MSNQPLMQDQNVTIDEKMAVINGTSYPIRAINSIAINKDTNTEKKKQIAVVLLIGCGLLFGGAPGVIAGLAVLAVGLYYLYSMKDVYYLNMMTTGGERRVLSSTDQNYLVTVRQGLERAVSAGA